jgi:hypothetical protein
MTHSAPAPPPHVAAQVREQVARAKQIVNAAQATQPIAAGDDQRDYVRHYLRFLSGQAVGRFSDALARLAAGLDTLGRRTATTQDKMSRTEQDVLHLASALESIERRLRAVEGGVAASSTPDVEASEGAFVAAALEHLRATASITAPTAILVPAPAGWTAALGPKTQRLAVEPVGMGYSDDVAVGDVTPGSFSLLTAICTFDELSLGVARARLADCRRALAADGALFVVTGPAIVSGRPSFLARVQARVSGPASLIAIARDAGFEAADDRSLGDRWPGFRAIRFTVR